KFANPYAVDWFATVRAVHSHFDVVPLLRISDRRIPSHFGPHFRFRVIELPGADVRVCRKRNGRQHKPQGHSYCCNSSCVHAAGISSEPLTTSSAKSELSGHGSNETQDQRLLARASVAFTLSFIIHPSALPQSGQRLAASP